MYVEFDCYETFRVLPTCSPWLTILPLSDGCHKSMLVEFGKQNRTETKSPPSVSYYALILIVARDHFSFSLMLSNNNNQSLQYLQILGNQPMTCSCRDRTVFGTFSSYWAASPRPRPPPRGPPRPRPSPRPR